jgi:YfiH family protein
MTAASGVMFFSSPTIARAGYVNGFSTRLGGVSPEPFSTLNLGNSSAGPQDAPEHITENISRFQSALGVPRHQLAAVNQVHGADVAIADTGSGRRAEPSGAQGDSMGACCADAIIVKTPELLASMRTADCVPILIASRDGRLAAAVHAGWRGLVAGIIGRCVAEMTAISGGGELIAAIGPCIGVNRYEVGPEVALAFEKAGLRAAVQDGDKPHIDLALAAQIELVHWGVGEIDSSPLCTFDRPEWFYSHRRDHGATGRMLSVIGLPL